MTLPARTPTPDDREVVVRGLAALLLHAWDRAPELRDERVADRLAPVSHDVPTEQLVTAIDRVAEEPDSATPHPERRGTAADNGPLSEREAEVLELLARGLTNRQIAEALYLSPETVKTYLSRLYGKLGVANRASAVVWAMERRLRQPEGR
jgi:DNA-binding NarL/FixJ family response regulator